MGAEVNEHRVASAFSDCELAAVLVDGTPRMRGREKMPCDNGGRIYSRMTHMDAAQSIARCVVEDLKQNGTYIEAARYTFGCDSDKVLSPGRPKWPDVMADAAHPDCTEASALGRARDFLGGWPAEHRKTIVVITNGELKDRAALADEVKRTEAQGVRVVGLCTRQADLADVFPEYYYVNTLQSGGFGPTAIRP